ncbi:hypothetical protein KO537_00440 [Shewanella sp. NKUCC01_JLK]|uniref:coiled-coil domain-containing protein n=1 Tax=Shewanella sp. NKUCC01_JLK TaxID=2842123 RepID=UPI001C5BCC6A|nr:hypothetical protein [Shewanella sp. NKUCC01_JLK]MBW3513203.1 hypothetical protein [Shewanella sp. NKUCC01_JLK]
MTTNPPPIDDSIKADEKPTDKPISFTWLFVVLGLIAALLLGLYFYHFWYILGLRLGSQSDFGTFGDFLGGVLNPILGFSTVVLLIQSLKTQREELADTRKVLEQTKEEAKLSRQAMEAQVEHSQKEAQLNEFRQVLAIQIGFIDKCLNTIVHKKKVTHNGDATYFNVSILDILNFDTDIKDEEYTFYQNQIKSKYPNPLSKNIKELEQHIFQYATLTLEYNEVSNYSFNTYPYLTKAITLISNLTTFSKSKNLDEPMAMLNSAIEQNIGTDND